VRCSATGRPRALRNRRIGFVQSLFGRRFIAPASDRSWVASCAAESVIRDPQSRRAFSHRRITNCRDKKSVVLKILCCGQRRFLVTDNPRNNRASWLNRKLFRQDVDVTPEPLPSFLLLSMKENRPPSLPPQLTPEAVPSKK